MENKSNRLDKFYTYIIYTGKDAFHSIGTTIDLSRRLGMMNQLAKCRLKLVYYEEYTGSEQAIRRENELLKLHHTIIDELVKDTNPMLINLI